MSADQVYELLYRMFCKVLDTEAVGPDDDFFALGGHSIAAGRVIGLIRRDLGARITLTEFFDEPTIHGLTERVLAAQPFTAR